MRFVMLIVALAVVALPIADSIGRSPFTFDGRAILFSIGPTTISLDSVLTVIGIVLLIGIWVFSRLSQGR